MLTHNSHFLEPYREARSCRRPYELRTRSAFSVLGARRYVDIVCAETTWAS
jgi:hypothetical protein